MGGRYRGLLKSLTYSWESRRPQKIYVENPKESHPELINEFTKVAGHQTYTAVLIHVFTFHSYLLMINCALKILNRKFQK